MNRSMGNSVPILSANHSTFRLIPEINEICKPLFDYTPIDTFGYAKLYPDGTSVMFDTHARWHEHIFMEQGFNENQLVSHQSSRIFEKYLQKHAIKPGLVTLNMVPEEVEITKEFGIIDGCALLDRENGDKESEIYEFFDFGSYHNLGSWMFYNFEVLEKFKSFFRMKASSIIKEHEQQKIFVPNVNGDLISEKLQSAHDVTTRNPQVLATIFDKEISKDKKLSKNIVVCLSPREKEILSLVYRGESAKTIANQCSVSYRTVEKQLQSIRKKLECSKINEAVYKAITCNLLEVELV